ncbi:MAG: hypothetical protein QGF55_00705, partial [SAR324 cluster bacterium]|nr:hypothetical protein [SAR324 cluster bacterium]
MPLLTKALFLDGEWHNFNPLKHITLIKSQVPMDQENLQARKEIAQRNVDHALWVKSMSQSKGDKNKAKIRYIELRSEQLKEKNQKSRSASVAKSPKQTDDDSTKSQRNKKNVNTIFKRLD